MKTTCKNGHDTLVLGRDKRGICVACRRAHGVRFNKDHPDKAREAQLKSLFRVTSGQYARMLSSQNDSCPGCLRRKSEVKKAFCVDHDHRCCNGKKSCGKCVRGLLCTSCNLILGYAKDNAVVLINLVKYLEK
jgi:hypothetical protein